MKVVIQRVKSAEVKADGVCTGKIESGLLLLVGIAKGDTEREAELLASKTVNLRIFEDENGKMNKSLLDINGSILSISQFTLCADCRHGRRPSFSEACPPEEAEELYTAFNDMLRNSGAGKIEKGVFGADMEVSLVNDGPVTIILDSRELI